MRVERQEKACTGEQRYAHEGSVIAHKRVAWLWQEGSVAMAGGQRGYGRMP